MQKLKIKNISKSITTHHVYDLRVPGNHNFYIGKSKILTHNCDYVGWKTQPALRTFIEEYSETTGFILTANYKNKIIDALQSRCPPIEFSFSPSDKTKLMAQFFKRTIEILNNEKVEFEPEVIAKIIDKYYPDWRRVLGELQIFVSKFGKIDHKILYNLKSASLQSLVGYMKKKDFTNVRQWCADNKANDINSLFRLFYDEAKDYFSVNYIPELVLTIARYQYYSAFVQDQEINLSAAIVEIMLGAVWK